MNKTVRARIFLAVSMAIFGTIGVFVRHIPVSSGELALYRCILASVLIGGFILITKRKIPFDVIKRQIPLLLLSGIAIGFNWILLFEAYRYTTVSVATLSYYFAPVIVTLACPILFHEKMGIVQWICFFASTLGIFLITGIEDPAGSHDNLTGILLGLGAACLYAAIILLNKFICGVDGIHRTFLQFFAATAVLIPYVAATSGFTVGSMDTEGWIFLLIVGLFHTGFTYCLYFSALRDLPGQESAILSYIDPLVAVLASYFILDESLSPLQIAGGALILGFTLWNEIVSAKKK